MKLSQLSLADYNQLDSIPVINKDLSASGFTPVANTYYRHTGATTASYTNGVIYLYNGTGYVALDGSAYGLATVAKTGSYNDLLDKPTIPTDYVPNTRKVNNKALSSDITLGPSDVGALPTTGGTVTGNLTVGGNLTINGTTTTVDSTTLQVKDKLIEVAHGNNAALTTPAGLVAPKYDGTNSGALVFDSTGTAYVGDVTLKDGNIDVANSELQPLATRTGLVGGNLVQYDSSAQTLKDSGKKISDLALKTDIPTNYVTTDTDQDIKGKKTVVPPSNKDNSNQIATTAWAGRRYKSIADFGFTSQTTVKAIVQKIIDNLYKYCTFACTNDDFNNFSDTPDGYGTLIIEVGSNALRPFISFTKQIGNSNSYKYWQANIVRGANNQVSEIQWYELALKTDIPTDIAKIGNLSNPNLLINPNFAINQRGQTSYTGTDYTVDRWKNSYGTLELQSNGEIKHISSNSWQGVAQYIENPSRLAGKTVTISAMGRGDGATAFRIYLYYQIGTNSRVTVCTAQTTATTNTIISASGTIPADITDNDKIYFMLYNSTANTSFYCKWAKLEVGSVATEFSPPSIAEELPKCQRYYQRYNFGNNMPLPLGVARNERTVSINFNIPKLRTNPTFATSGTVKLLNQNITGLTLTYNQYYDGVCRLFIETSGLSAGTGILIAGATDGYYAFDAEI